MKRLLVAAGLAAIALAGCETATPYQPLTHNAEASGGYTDLQIEPNRWRVTFSGNDLTSRETVERYLLFRAAQLTVDQGFDWFTTTERNTNRRTEYYGDTFGPWGGYWDPEWGFYRRGFGWGYGYWGGPRGWGGFGPGWGPGFDVTEAQRFQASAEIVMGHGPKPADPRAFDARAVISHLQGTIIYPKTTR